MTIRRRAMLATIAILGLVAGAARAQDIAPQAKTAAPSAELVEFRPAPATPWRLVPDRLTLRGSLVDDRGEAVAGAEVRAEIAGLRAVTDSHGHFILPNVVTPDDRITVTHPDYVSLTLAARALYAGAGGEAFLRTAKYRETFDIGPEGGIYRGDKLVLEVPRGAVFSRLTLRAASLPPALALDRAPGLQGKRVATLALAPAGLVFEEPIRLRLPLAGGRRSGRALRVLTLDARTDGDDASNDSGDGDSGDGDSGDGDSGDGDSGDGGLFVADPGASIITDAGMAILSVDHLGRFAIVDPESAVSRHRLLRTFDVNGDGRLTTEDAALVALLSGPGQALQWQQGRQAGGQVMAVPKDRADPGQPMPAGLSIGGVRLDAAGALSRRRGDPIMAELGLAATPPAAHVMVLAAHAMTLAANAMTLAAPGDVGKCVYALRWKDYWRAGTWRRHRLAEPERARLRAALEQPRQDQNRAQDSWRYFRVEGATPLAAGTTLYSGDRIAARAEDGGLAVYLQTGDYVVRAPVGAAARACGGGNLRERVNRDRPLEDFSFFGGGESLAQATFVGDGDGYRSFRYAGWGILPGGAPERYDGLGCGVTLSGRWVPRPAPRVLDAPLPVSLAPGIALSLPPSPGGDYYDPGVGEDLIHAALAHATGFSGDVEAGVDWTIATAAARADHLLFGLNLVFTSRDWRSLPRDEVPRALRARLATGVEWTDGRVFAAVGDQVYMAHADGSWYRGSAMLAVTREIGLLMLSGEARACDADGALATAAAAPLIDPRMVRFAGPGGAGISIGRDPVGQIIAETETGAGTARALFDSAGRVTEVTNDAGEVTRIDYDGEGRVVGVTDMTGAVVPVEDPARELESAPGPADDFAAPRVPDPPGPPVDIPADAVTVPLTGLDGVTVLNRALIGALESLRLIDGEGREMSLGNAGARVDENAEAIRLVVANPEGLAGVLLAAANGAYHLMVTTQELPPPGFLRPLDGMVDIPNGRVRETVGLPERLIDLEAPLSGHRVTVARQSVEIVALRAREAALTGDRILAPDGARATIVVEGPSGARASAEVPAWGYRILVQPVTNPNLSVPVRIQVTGLAPGEKLRVRFLAGEFQTIEPTTVTLSAGQARMPVPIAQFTTTRIGAQNINATVEKLP